MKILEYTYKFKLQDYFIIVVLRVFARKYYLSLLILFFLISVIYSIYDFLVVENMVALYWGAWAFLPLVFVFIVTPIRLYFKDKKSCKNKITYILTDKTLGYKVGNNSYEYGFEQIKNAKVFGGNLIRFTLQDGQKINLYLKVENKSDIIKNFKEFL